MSTWFSQYIVYGVPKTDAEYKQWLKVREVEEVDEDKHWAVNRKDGYGFILEDDCTFFGQIVVWPEDNGNDNLLAAESGTIELKLLDEVEARRVQSSIDAEFHAVPSVDARYYILGIYS